MSVSTNYERLQSRITFKTTNNDNDTNTKFYNCCLVKITHHIKGFLRTEKSRINFILNEL